MAYTKQTWTDAPSTTTPISAARLNYIEAGIEAAADYKAGDVIFVTKSGGTWPARPTSRSDVLVIWSGPLPSPSVVSSGTGGMLNNVDKHFVTP